MFCGKCGHPIKEGSSFCGECGAPVRKKKQKQPVKIPVSPVTELPPKKRNTPTVAGILKSEIPEPKPEKRMPQLHKDSEYNTEDDKLIIHMGNKAPSPEMKRDFEKYFSEAKNLNDEKEECP